LSADSNELLVTSHSLIEIYVLCQHRIDLKVDEECFNPYQPGGGRVLCMK